METTKAIQPIDSLRTELQSQEEQFKTALPNHIPVEKFMRVVITAVQMSPNLLKAERKSLFSSCMKCAQDGLLPDGREAALVPFMSQGQQLVQYIPMIGGILKKVRNSGDLSSITSQIVYKNDDFKYWVDDSGEHVTHNPLLFGDRGEPIGVYALAKTKDGAVYIEVLNMNQVMAVKTTVKAKSGPWFGPFEHEMWRKTAIRKLSKRLPMSTDLEDLIRRDDEMYDLSRAEVANADKAAKLSQMIGLSNTAGTQADEVAGPIEVESAPASEPEPVNDIPLGATVIEVGKKYVGKTFDEVGKEALTEFATSSHNWFIDEKKPMNAKWQEFFEKAERYCFGSA